MPIPMRLRWVAWAAALLLPLSAGADVQVVSVSTGLSAVLVIDGGTPVELEIGQSYEGVELLGANRSGAVLLVDGVERRLPLVPYDGSLEASATQITLQGDGRRFLAEGEVNGGRVQFVVDTGATITALTRSQADGVGLYYEEGQRVRSRTPGGMVDGWLVWLDSLEVEGVVIEGVEAVVVDNDTMGVGLLGMNVLNHFDMQRQGSTLVLRLRP